MDALSFIQVYRSIKPCVSFLEHVSLRVPPSNLREFSRSMPVPLTNTVLLLSASMLPMWCLKFSTYLHDIHAQNC
jgi:hypothetical protein